MTPRIVAGLLLIAFLLPSALLPTTGRIAPGADCPFGAGSAPTVIATTGDTHCGHSIQSSCQVLPCTIVAPAIGQVPTTLVAAPGLILVPLASTARFVDLFRTGPPTPPPNQV